MNETRRQPEGEQVRTSRRRWPWVLLGVLAGAAVLTAVLLGSLRNLVPELTEEELRSVVVTTIQREAPRSFLVTGALDMTTIATGEDVKYLLPESARIPLGTARATVRVPGRASYGFDIRRLEPEDIELGADGVVDVTLPELRVYSVAPDLSRMEVQTEVGWQRRLFDSGEVERPALQLALRKAQEALRKEAVRYMRESTQPQVYAARAVEAMLRPALVAAGVENPRFRFRIGPRLVMEPPG